MRAAAVGQAPVERQVVAWPGWSTLHADGAIPSCCCYVNSTEEQRSDRGAVHTWLSVPLVRADVQEVVVVVDSTAHPGAHERTR